MKTKEDKINNILTVKHYLYHFWPELMPKAAEIYDNISQNKHKSLEELWTPDDKIFSTIKTKNETALLKYVGKKPVVVCAFHLGGYRLPTRYLMKENIPHSVVMNIKSQDALSSFDQTVMNFLQERDKTNDVSIINIAKRTALIEIIRLMKANRALLIYPDANLNTKETSSSKNSVEVSFFGQKLRSQVGSAFFSYKFKAPIVPIVTYREGADNILAFQEPIIPNNESQQEYYQRSTQQLWSILEKYVRQYPLQWEGWLFAGKRLSRPEVSTDYREAINNASSKFNAHRYDFAEKGNEFFLFDLASKKMISVSKDLFQFLKKLKTLKVTVDNKVLTKVLNKNIFQQMHALGILQ